MVLLYSTAVVSYLQEVHGEVMQEVVDLGALEHRQVPKVVLRPSCLRLETHTCTWLHIINFFFIRWTFNFV